MLPGRDTDVRHRRTRTGYAWQIPLGLAAALAVVSVFASPSTAQWLVVAGGVVAVAAIARSSIRTGGRRADRHRFRGGHPLALISAGLWLTVAGEVLHAGGAGYPSYADAVGLCAYPFVVLGLLRIVRARVMERAVDTLLIAAIVPAALGAFGWIPLVESWSGHGAAGQAWVAVAFLVVDALAFAMVARLTVLFRARPVADRLLLAAFAALLGAHVSRAAATATDVVPAPFGSQTLLLVAFGLLAAAALHPSLLPSMSVSKRPPSIGRGHVGLMAVAVLLGPSAVLWRYGHASRWFVFTVAGTAVVSLLVVAHLGRLVRERGRLEFESTHDPLTGLPNRLQFGEDLVHAMLRANGRRSFAIGFIDLDRFKKVNDSLGHGAGDELLRQVADRLHRHVRHDDVVARLAGDEFGLLLADVGTVDEAREIAERVLAGFADEFRVAGQSLFMTPSIGLALYPDHGDDPDLLLRHADAAMYEAKRLGRNTIEVFSERLRALAHQQLAMETRLQIGIGNGELVVHYQPKVSLHTGQVTGVEALVRWDHPTIGLVPPGAFMRLAEETGLVASIGEQVLLDACRQMQSWRQRGFPDLTVSVNLSLRQFNLQDVVAVVTHALAETGLPPHALELELTESSDLNQADAVGPTLTALRTLGVRCSIDDFGTGYSGIAYLNDLPIDKIKLDKSFIDTIGADGGDAPLVRAMIAMAHSLDLEVVAEGVETPDQLRFLQEQGCDTIQGFLFSRPLPAGDLRSVLGAQIDADRPTLQLVRPNGVQDERELGERLWAEAQVQAAAVLAVASDEADEDVPETLARRTLVLSSVAGVMAVPALLGLTAASALPPAAQSFVAAGFTTIGATPPRPHGTHGSHGTPMAGHQAGHQAGHGPTDDPTSTGTPAADHAAATSHPTGPPATPPGTPEHGQGHGDPGAGNGQGTDGQGTDGHGADNGQSDNAGHGAGPGTSAGKSKGKSKPTPTPASGQPSQTSHPAPPAHPTPDPTPSGPPSGKGKPVH